MTGVRIDLHTHSAESDGTDTPAELLAAAISAGLDVIALTDHDTTAGWAEVARAVRDEPVAGRLRVIPGAELSCRFTDGRGPQVHLLAYLFDPASPALAREQLRLRAERRQRLHEMAQRMAGDGLPVQPDELMAALPPDAPAGRPHLGRALVRAGIVDSVQEAFQRFLGWGGKYYLPRTNTPVLQAIDMINEAGGATVLAHPLATSYGPIIDAEMIAELAAHGLRGVEVDHPNHDAAARAELSSLAAELELIPTGSSDYHGTNKTISIGQETTTPAAMEQLIEQCTGAKVFG